MSTLTFSGFIKYGLKDKASHGNCKIFWFLKCVRKKLKHNLN